MSQITFGAIKAALARSSASGVCADDPRVLSSTNQSVERLLPAGNWVGSVDRLSVCASSSCVTLPRKYDHIIGYNVKGAVGATRTYQAEIQENGPGLLTSCSSDSSSSGCHGPGNKSNVITVATDRGNVPLWVDICGHKKLKFYCDVSEAASATIIIRGWDLNGNWVRSFVDGEWIDGEVISLTNVSPQTSVNIWSKVDSIIKSITNGFVRVYQVDPDTLIQSLTAIYEPTETVPGFRRYMIPGVPCACNGDPVRISVVAKKGYVPITNDNDILLIQNLTALILCNKSNEFIEQDNLVLSQQYFMEAKEELNKQLYNHNQGAHYTLSVQMQGSPGEIYQSI